MKQKDELYTWYWELSTRTDLTSDEPWLTTDSFLEVRFPGELVDMDIMPKLMADVRTITFSGERNAKGNFTFTEEVVA